MKVYIEYGWPEGKWHAKQLVKALESSGFEVVNKAEEAGIVIAHSGGCYMLPKEITPKLVLYIGLPNWPGRIVPVSTLKKWSIESKNLHWFEKLFYQGVYFFNPITALKTWQFWRQKALHDYPSANTILIRNERDTYMHREISLELARERKWQFLELSGMHDDIWEDPQRYVDLIRGQLVL